MVYDYDINDPDPSEVKQYWIGSQGPYEVVNTLVYQPEGILEDPDQDVPQDLEALRTLRGDQIFLNRDPSTEEEAVRLGAFQAAERVLSTATGIDLSATGITTLWTPEALSRYTGIIIQPTSYSGVTGLPTIRVGRNGGAADEYVFATELTWLNSTDESQRIPANNLTSNMRTGVAPANNVEFEVVTAITGTFIVNVHLLGFFF